MSVEDGRLVRLDERPIRTPGRAPLVLPTPELAEAIADEWRGAGETVRLEAMPLTRLAYAAIDRDAEDREEIVTAISRCGETDLLYYRAGSPDDLVARQEALWDPLLAWATRRYDVAFERARGVIHRAQPLATVQRLRDAVAAQDAWVLAALARIVPITGSLVASLALIEGGADAETVWRAGALDEEWQAEQWGEDALAIGARSARRFDFDAAVRLLHALKARA